MKASYARAMYGVQGAEGTVADTWLPIGLVDRPHVEIPAGIERIYSVGDWNAKELSEGMTLANVGFSIVALEEWDLLQQARRSDVTGELPWLSFKWGYIKGAVHLTVTVIDLKVDTMTLRCDAGGRVNVDMALIGGKVEKADADPGNMDFFGSRAYRWFEMVWDETRDLLAFEMNVRNNLTPQPVIAGSGTTRDPDRKWDYLDEGNNEIDGTLSYFLGDATIDLQACLIEGANHDLAFQTCADVSPAQAATLTLTELKLTGEDHQANVGGNIVVVSPFMATDWEVTD